MPATSSFRSMRKDYTIYYKCASYLCAVPKYVVVGLGINDIAFPGSLTPASESIKAESIIAAYRQLITRAHKRGIRIIGTTNPPFENSFLELGPPAPPITF